MTGLYRLRNKLVARALCCWIGRQFDVAIASSSGLLSARFALGPLLRASVGLEVLVKSKWSLPSRRGRNSRSRRERAPHGGPLRRNWDRRNPAPLVHYEIKVPRVVPNA